MYRRVKTHHLVIADEEKAKRADELANANKEKGKRAAELIIANADKAKRAAEFVVVSRELALSQEKEKLIEELTKVNEKLSHEIEKRIQSDKALKESEIKSYSIMENSADATFLTNQHGNYIYINKLLLCLDIHLRK